MEREELLRMALELGAIAEALEAVPFENADLAYARERVEALRSLVDDAVRRQESD